jgi:Domain of unknown function (DUF4258)
MDYELTQHARIVVAERQIQVAWVERALSAPNRVDPSASDPALESRFVCIPEFGDRILRVVVNKQVAPERVVSAYFDRAMKDKL